MQLQQEDYPDFWFASDLDTFAYLSLKAFEKSGKKYHNFKL